MKNIRRNWGHLSVYCIFIILAVWVIPIGSADYFFCSDNPDKCVCEITNLSKKEFEWKNKSMWWYCDYFPAETAAGRVTGWIYFERDINKQIEQAKESCKSYKKFVQNPTICRKKNE